MTSPRQELARQIASGVAGWYQLQVTQNLGRLSGEDAARVVVAQIVNARGRYLPATSQLPPNWGSTKRRVDIALKGRSEHSVGWYGAIEVKWVGENFDPHQLRLNVVQDAMRLAFVRTTNTNAKFLVLGGATSSLDQLFDQQHPNAPEREQRREAFRELFRRERGDPDGFATHATWRDRFPGSGDRIPDTVFNSFDGRLKAELLAKAGVRVGPHQVGSVFVWQCKRTRGTARDV